MKLNRWLKHLLGATRKENYKDSTSTYRCICFIAYETCPKYTVELGENWGCTPGNIFFIWKRYS